MKKLLLAAAVLAAAWVAWGVAVRGRRADRPPMPQGELRGAWHVHTSHSDGRGTLAEVVRAAREAGLSFVVIADHNVLAPGEAGWHDRVLVVEATEASTRYGHVVALGVPRPLTPEEREDDPLGAIRRLGGAAILAHPLHPRRPFTGWGTGPWRGLEVVSNDTAWSAAVDGGAVATVARAALDWPWDGAQAVIALSRGRPSGELALFDAEERLARAGRDRKVLLCSADAHGYPSYRAAFEAFSMHVPVTPSGDGAADARAVSQALLDGRAACVFDGVAPASGVRLTPGAGRSLWLVLEVPAGASAGEVSVRLVRDGATVGETRPALAPGLNSLRVDGLCGPAGCAPGDYRAEARRDGRPWIFTNPAALE